MADLPRGTITLLFTDIEGSTALWERCPAAMAIALARHDTVLHQAIAAHGGTIFKTVGDQFCAVFPTATGALAAALAAQHALQREAWGDVGALRVRMALHTGVAEQRNGDYFGPPLNRVARLLDAGHGGQILLSAVTYELVHTQISPGVSLRSLGAHRLKDLPQPEPIFQLVTPDLPADFPPLRSLAHPRTTLPGPATSLIGRHREVAVVCELLTRLEVRLITLTGPGGVGKTRLAQQVATELQDSFTDGVCFVALAPIQDPALVVSTITQALGVLEAGGQSLKERLMDYLRDQQLLLVLDNFEQVVAAAPFVAELLAACPRLKVLLTSRTVLHLYGEHEFSVPPLALPDPKHLPPAAQLPRYAAVRLFLERAQAVRADFALTQANARAVVEICHRLDGLPLAIELAAARVKLLPPQALLARLDNRLKLLTGGARDLPLRQQTLRNTIDWSYQLLEVGDQLLFARLGVFMGGCTLEAAEAVCSGVEPEDWGLAGGDAGTAPSRKPQAPSPPDVIEGLQSLLDKSLLHQAAEGTDGEPRFMMLETIREYALERLEASGEAETIQRQHAHFFLALAEESEAQLQGSEQAAWLHRLEAEHDNLRAAIAWLLSNGDTETGVRLTGALVKFWSMRSYFDEGRGWLERLLAQASERTVGWAKAFYGAGLLAYRQGASRLAHERFIQSLALYRELDERLGVATVLCSLGELARSQGDYAGATAHYKEGLALYQELGDQPGIALALNGLGYVAGNQNDYETARGLLEESLKRYRELGDKSGNAQVLYRLGTVAYCQGAYAQARDCLEDSLAMQREMGNKWAVAYALNNLGLVMLREAEYPSARACFDESYTSFQELGDKNGTAVALTNLGEAARIEGDDESAAAYYTQSLALYRALGNPQGIALLFCNLGYVAHRHHDDTEAARMFQESLWMSRDLGDTEGIATCLAGLAGVLGGQGQLIRAARLLGAVEALLNTIGTSLAAADAAEYNRTVAAVRTQLGEAAFQAALAVGQTMSVEQAITEALGSAG